MSPAARRCRPRCSSRSSSERLAAETPAALRYFCLPHTQGSELRAAASLAQLLRDGGRAAEARHVLAPVYSAFTEGFERPDLVAAKALLAELG